jgi:hypothetical protein
MLAARMTLNLDGVHGVINKGWLKQWVWRREEEKWREDVGSRASLTLYPKECLKGGETYVGGEGIRSVMAKLRLGAVGRGCKRGGPCLQKGDCRAKGTHPWM